jgi:tRNA(Ile)-lysidine synthase
VLAADWARSAGGTVLALIVDHGLRPNSATEAAMAVATLDSLGIPAQVLTLVGFVASTGLPARARAARFATLERACREAGIIDLLLGHHMADQAETVLMRRMRGSGPTGLAGMAAITETASVRLLRPLLGVPPGRLRLTLAARGLGWAEDPTNADIRFTRARLRAMRADAAGTGAATRALAEAAGADGRRRREAEGAIAGWLASAATIRPEGFALLPEGSWPPAALAALLRMITGADHRASAEAIAAIARAPNQAIGGGLCLGGARLRPAGRLGPGFLICREAAAMAAPVAAEAGAVWDGRFRRPRDLPYLPGETIGALGSEARGFRDLSDLPAMVLETLPAYRSSQAGLIAVPALLWPDPAAISARRLLFHPRQPSSGARFGVTIAPPGRSCHDGNVVPA